MNTSISLCMIVRDEEELLGKCLESVKDVVDEIIVVDTGSRDGTVSLARSFGAKILMHEWENNFSVPRNISLENANGDWILVLDADETLETQSKAKMIDTLQQGKAPGYRVLIQLSPEWTEMRSLRLFKNSSRLRYQGIFHERLAIPDQDYSRYVPSDIRIIHKPFCRDDVDRKMSRNINLLKKHVALYRDDIYQILDLIRLYLETDNFSEAEKLLNNVRILLSRTDLNERDYKVYHAHYFFYKFQLYSKKNIELKDMLSLCEDAILIVPRCPWFLYEAAKIYYKLSQYDKAIDYFQQCLALGESQDFNRSMMFPKDIMGVWSLTGLGHCFFNKHDYQESAHYFKESYSHDQNDKVMAMINFSNLLIKKEEEQNQ